MITRTLRIKVEGNGWDDSEQKYTDEMKKVLLEISEYDLISERREQRVAGGERYFVIESEYFREE